MLMGHPNPDLQSVLHVITHMILQTPSLSTELFGVALKDELLVEMSDLPEMPTIGPD